VAFSTFVPMYRFTTLVTLLFLATLRFVAAEEIYSNVKIHRHRSAQNRVLVDKVGTLTFDDVNNKLTFSGSKLKAQDQIDVGYDAVTKVVFEVTTHMRGGRLARAIEFAGIPGLMVGTTMSAQHVNDYWLFLEYRQGDHDEQVLLEVPKDSSQDVIEKANHLFGSRVTIAAFAEKGADIKPETLPDFESTQSLKVDKNNHPFPDPQADKATIIVVCPPLSPSDSGHGNQFKLHANDRVVAVNKQGTYSFAYIDPGKYRLVSQSENANGFEMQLDAGKTYYFLQNTFLGALRGHTALSRNSPELVTYLAGGAYYSDWTRK
jgi:hypothetical protein